MAKWEILFKKAMVSGLDDKYAAYYTKDDIRIFQKRQKENFVE